MDCLLIAGLVILALFVYFLLVGRTRQSSSRSASPASDSLGRTQQDELDEVEWYNRNHDRDGTPYGAIEDLFMAEEEEGG